MTMIVGELTSIVDLKLRCELDGGMIDACCMINSKVSEEC